MLLFKTFSFGTHIEQVPLSCSIVWISVMFLSVVMQSQMRFLQFVIHTVIDVGKSGTAEDMVSA